ncbi:MAG: SelB domain-containing protein, partial [Planctomycetota bacterium]
KVDLVEPDMKELVVEEIRDVVKGTFLEDAPVLAVSAATGEGFDALIDMINRMVAETPARRTEGAFRMPIQRVFSVRGFGTGVTGVPVSGRAAVGDSLEILPPGTKGRVRNLHAYKTEVGEVRAGHSSAVNITDVVHTQVHRGMVAATPGVFRASYFVEARMRYVPERGRPLRNLMPVKLHVGTAEADGRIVLLDKKKLEPGEEALVQFRLEEPVVVADGDPFIVRLQSPLWTIGGGRVLDSSGAKLRRFRDEIEKRLAEKEAALEDPGAAVEFYVKDCGHRLVNEKDVAEHARVPVEVIRDSIRKIFDSDRVVKVATGRFIHRETLESALDLMKRRLERFHADQPLAAGLELARLRSATGFEESFFALAIDTLKGRGEAAVERGRASLASFRVKLGKEDSEAAVEIEDLVRQGRFATPRREEIGERFPRYNRERIDRVLTILEEQGAVLRLKEGVLMHRDTIEEAKGIIADYIGEHGQMEASKLRDLTGTTRKYVIPLLEHLDGIGFTVRKGNVRVLREGK